jgi:hypothetical protein
MGSTGVGLAMATGWLRKGVLGRVSLVTCMSGARSLWVGFFIRRNDFLLLFRGVAAGPARNGSFSAALSSLVIEASFFIPSAFFLLESRFRL